METSSTLFVAELPEDIEQDALMAIFGNYQGFQSLRLRKDKNQHQVAFLEFSDVSEAVSAKEQATGMKLGPEEKVIAIQYAHKQGRNNNMRNNYQNNGNFRNNNQKGNSFVNSDRNHSAQPLNFSLMSTPFANSPSNGVMNLGGVMLAPVDNYQQKAPGPVRKQSLGQSELPPFYSVGPSPLAFTSVGPALDQDASSTLYVEGLPLDATEREVSHIFRQWPGFQSLRILQKEKQFSTTPRTYNLCFVEFDNKHQATLAMNHIQGYRFDKNDSRGINLTYAKSERKEKRSNKPNPPQATLDI
eukprot:TRINITY_DN3615_c0_g1_i1.p1 TRINITY_DN3615_c0_g1~~TRINITY_DN3615_c0_g1_i1.p1  ORF type:complete len:301 (+),score=129.44 TRINITY_DN3615_c0_g1_i1:233-1135(+)